MLAGTLTCVTRAAGYRALHLLLGAGQPQQQQQMQQGSLFGRPVSSVGLQPYVLAGLHIAAASLSSGSGMSAGANAGTTDAGADAGAGVEGAAGHYSDGIHGAHATAMQAAKLAFEQLYVPSLSLSLFFFSFFFFLFLHHSHAHTHAHTH